jgi:hypothetical protein
MTAANDTRKATLRVVRDEPDNNVLQFVETPADPTPKKEKIETAKTEKTKSDPNGKLPSQPQGYISYPDYDCL